MIAVVAHAGTETQSVWPVLAWAVAFRSLYRLFGPATGVIAAMPLSLPPASSPYGVQRQPGLLALLLLLLCGLLGLLGLFCQHLLVDVTHLVTEATRVRA